MILSWSVATPWQGGSRHVNNRDPSELLAVMSALGYALDVAATKEGRAAATHDFFQYSLSVFRRRPPDITAVPAARAATTPLRYASRRRRLHDALQAIKSSCDEATWAAAGRERGSG
eukprot:137784-Prymnesium_polylepis.1